MKIGISDFQFSYRSHSDDSDLLRLKFHILIQIQTEQFRCATDNEAMLKNEHIQIIQIAKKEHIQTTYFHPG